MKYLLASGSRSGSMFSIELLEKFAGAELNPICKVSSARQSVGDWNPSYRDCRAAGNLVGFVTGHRLNALKLEDPGMDDDAAILLEAFPRAVVVATYRPVEKVVNSHGNIKPWGFPPEKAVSTWIANLGFYEKANLEHRLVLIPLDDPSKFSAEAASQRLGLTVSDDVRTFVRAWPTVNDLKHQKQVSNDSTPVDFQMSRDELIAQFPEIPAADERYRALVIAANGEMAA